MYALDKKLFRELWAMRLQAIAIAFVIMGGVAIFVMSLTTLDSLQLTTNSYYRDNNLAQVFANVKRAPLAIVPRIEEIPGVNKVEARVLAYVNIDVEGFDDPISGHLLSLPNNSPGALNQIYLRSGQLLDGQRSSGVLISESFAKAHGLRAGDVLWATINGRRKKLDIEGVAMSPEYIYQIAPGAMFPDYARYGIFWMTQDQLASAYDMQGAFNYVTLTLEQGVNEQDVIDRLDEVLEVYGGFGAFGRENQLSARFMTEELKQQRTIATVFPTIFFGVAAFLLNVVVSRLMNLEREQIATLKAFGYSTLDVGIHYGKLVLIIVMLGVVLGVGAGIWMGKNLSQIYMNFFNLPYINYVIKPQVIIAVTIICCVVAIAGTWFALKRAAKLPPAQAMRPQAPVSYRVTFIEKLGWQHWFSQPSRMIFRHIERKPFKSFLTTLGIAMACGTMMVGGFQEGAIDYMVEVQFKLSQREDVIVNFSEPTSQRALYSIQELEGIHYAEGFRNVPVELKFQHRTHRTAIQGLRPDSQLKRVLDTELNRIELPKEGIVLTDYLADLLHARVGDVLTVDVLEGRRQTLSIPVAGVTREYMGTNAYMQTDELNRHLGEGYAITGALLEVDQTFQNEIYRALKDMPRVAGVVEQRAAIDSFYETIAETILYYTFITTLLGGSIAFGVVYNSMRIALSERHRELASLRVLGFEKDEVAYILLGEMAVLTFLAIPLGLLIGYGLCAYLAFQFDSDLYRIPLRLHPSVFAFAPSVVFGSAILSAFVIWRSIASLDMVAVLKTKE